MMIRIHPGVIRMLRGVALCLPALCVSAPLAPARGAAPSLEEGAPKLAVQRYLLARDHYANGRFKEALADFQVAFGVFPSSPKLAYNLARTHERLEMWADAQKLYRRYLELLPGAADRAEVEAVIAVLDERQQPKTALGTPPAPLSAAPARTPARQAPPPSLATRVAPARQDTHPTWATPVGWSAVGLGAVGLGLGVYGYMSADRAATEVSDLPPGQGDRYDRLSQDVETGNALSVGGLAGGLVLGAAGALLLTWPFDGSDTVVRAVPATDGVSAQLNFILGPRL